MVGLIKFVTKYINKNYKILDNKLHLEKNRLFDPTDYKNVYDRVDLLMIEIQELRTELAKDKTVEYDTAI